MFERPKADMVQGGFKGASATFPKQEIVAYGEELPAP
jgi:hypothetical protein